MPPHLWTSRIWRMTVQSWNLLAGKRFQTRSRKLILTCREIRLRLQRVSGERILLQKKAPIRARSRKRILSWRKSLTRIRKRILSRRKSLTRIRKRILRQRKSLTRIRKRIPIWIPMTVVSCQACLKRTRASGS